LPAEYRNTPYLPFSPPVNQVGLSTPSHRGPRQSAATDFLPSPPVAGFDDYTYNGGNAEAGPSRARTRHGIEIEEEDDAVEEDLFQLAKSYFDIKELDRVVHTLKGAKGARARFLRNYAAFLVSWVSDVN
jgi:anaphase-promoting complex subunit 8